MFKNEVTNYGYESPEINYENTVTDCEDPVTDYTIPESRDADDYDGLAGKTLRKGIKKKDKKIKKMNKRIKKLENKKKNRRLRKKDRKKLMKLKRQKKKMKKDQKSQIKEYKLQISRMQNWAGLAMFAIIDSHPKRKEILDAITASMIKQYFTQVNPISFK